MEYNAFGFNVEIYPILVFIFQSFLTILTIIAAFKIISMSKNSDMQLEYFRAALKIYDKNDEIFTFDRFGEIIDFDPKKEKNKYTKEKPYK